MRDEAPGRDVAASLRRGNEGDLRHDLLRHVAEAHQRASGEADLLDARLQLTVLVELVAWLVARTADRARFEHDHRHAVVDQRAVDAGDPVNGIAGREQRAADGASRVEEVDRDGRGRARHAVDARAALVIDISARRLDQQVRDGAGVERAHAHARLLALRRKEPALDGERPDAREDVAAVRRGVDHRLVDADLGEQEIDVGPRLARSRDDGDLARQRVGAANAIDLARVGRSHDRQERPIARDRI